MLRFAICPSRLIGIKNLENWNPSFNQTDFSSRQWLVPQRSYNVKLLLLSIVLTINCSPRSKAVYRRLQKFDRFAKYIVGVAYLPLNHSSLIEKACHVDESHAWSILRVRSSQSSVCGILSGSLADQMFKIRNDSLRVNELFIRRDSSSKNGDVFYLHTCENIDKSTENPKPLPTHTNCCCDP